MGTDTLMVALDSNAMTYWLEAMASIDSPPADPNALEKIALARIFFWMPPEACFHITPTVEVEYEAIKAQSKLENHRSWALTHVSKVRPLPEASDVEKRTHQLLKAHGREKDCRIVAECELTEIETLLSCDVPMLNRMRDQSPVRICRPTEYWQHMAVPIGTRPTAIPSATNPLSTLSWWHW